jgi:integrase
VRRLAGKARPILRDFIWFAALSGMRRGEILSLTPDSIIDGAARLAISKSGRARAVPLPQAALRIAKRRLPWQLTISNLNKLFREARESAGMEHVRLHDLRHTYASWLVQAGESLATVRDLLGHSSLQVTSRYAHLDLQHLRRAVARLPQIGHRLRGKRRGS